LNVDIYGPQNAFIFVATIILVVGFVTDIYKSKGTYRLIINSRLSHFSAISSQFHQHFYIQIFRTNLVLAVFSSYFPALASKFRMKNARVHIDEIDTWWPHLGNLLYPIWGMPNNPSKWQ